METIQEDVKIELTDRDGTQKTLYFPQDPATKRDIAELWKGLAITAMLLFVGFVVLLLRTM